MRNKWIIFLIGLVIAIVLAGFFVSRFIKITGPVIWVDRSSRGSWKMGENAASWWEELSILNPRMIDQSRWVVVYLLPNLQESKVAFGRKDKPPTLFADWRIWGRGTQVLTISVNWDEWEAIKPEDRQERLAEFVTTQIADYWGVIDKDRLAHNRKILAGEVDPPIQLEWSSRGGQ